MAQVVHLEGGTPQRWTPLKVLLTLKNMVSRNVRREYQFVSFVKSHFLHGLNKQSIRNGNMEIKIHTHVKHVTKSLHLPAPIKNTCSYMRRTKKDMHVKSVGNIFTFPHSWIDTVMYM